MTATADPEAARQLVRDCMAHGWSVVYKPGVDTGQNPFVTVEAGRETERLGPEYFRVTWHTRETGTYRLFDAAYGKWKQSASRATLAKIQGAVTA